MITSQDPSTATRASSATRAGGKCLYPLLLVLETAGAVLLCSQVLPIYRKALADPKAFDPETTEYTLAAVALMQIGYWVGYWIRPARPRVVNVVLGHIVLFVARLLFLLPTAVFSFLFIAKTLELPASRYLVIIFGLFALFCYVRELERLGNSLLGRAKG